MCGTGPWIEATDNSSSFRFQFSVKTANLSLLMHEDASPDKSKWFNVVNLENNVGSIYVRKYLFPQLCSVAEALTLCYRCQNLIASSFFPRKAQSKSQTTSLLHPARPGVTFRKVYFRSQHININSILTSYPCHSGASGQRGWIVLQLLPNSSSVPSQETFDRLIKAVRGRLSKSATSVALIE